MLSYLLRQDCGLLLPLTVSLAGSISSSVLTVTSEDFVGLDIA
jgi:hypothetical protein